MFWAASCPWWYDIVVRSKQRKTCILELPKFVEKSVLFDKFMPGFLGQDGNKTPVITLNTNLSLTMRNLEV